MERIIALALSLLFTFLPFVGWAQPLDPIQWAPPVALKPTPLPPLADSPLLDGELKEWASAACIPVHAQSCIARQAKGHSWNGPTDAGLEFYAAWTKEALCLGMIVADDDVQSAVATDADLWEQDSIELNVGAQPPGPTGASPPCQFLIRPPVGGNPAALTQPRGGLTVTGAQIADQRTPTGYAVEITIPWEALKLTPQAGLPLGFDVVLNDYDARDKNAQQPLSLSVRGEKHFPWQVPLFVPAVLADGPVRGPGAPLGAQVTLDAPVECHEPGPVVIGVEIGASLAAQTGSADLRITDPAGSPVLREALPLGELPSPWTASRRAVVAWTPGDGAMDGTYLATVTMRDAEGKELGVASHSILLTRATRERLLAGLARADLPTLSQADPFRAAAYLAVAACYDRARHTKATRDQYAKVVYDNLREGAARLRMLEQGILPDGPPGLYSLLLLTAAPGSQVTVDFENPGLAGVTFSSGSVPIAMAVVEAVADEANGRRRLSSEDVVLAETVESLTLAHCPARLATTSYEGWRVSPWNLKPAEQVLIINTRDKVGLAIELRDLASATAEAATILPECPQAVSDVVAAQGERLPVLDLAEALTRDRVVLAGKFTHDTVLPILNEYRVHTGVRHGTSFSTKVLARDRLITVHSPSRFVTLRAAELVAAGRPVTAADTEALRGALVEALARDLGERGVQAKSVPQGMRVFTGDPHVHTSYSFDALFSPVSRGLQAMYVGMEFIVVTDHNEVQGGLVVADLFRRHGLGFSLIPGEEITTNWAHFNAYPLKELIKWWVTDTEIIEAAREQGAVIQWNHPGYSGSEWEKKHMETAMADLDMDAWEHVPGRYHHWKETGQLPLLIGSSDGHGAGYVGAERSAVIAPTPGAEDVADAVRGKRVMIVANKRERFFGDDATIAQLLSAIQDGATLTRQRMESITQALRGADIVAVLRTDLPPPQY